MKYFTLLILLICPSLAFAASSPLKVCVQANGNVVARAKCSAKERKLTTGAFVTQSTQSVFKCRQITNTCSFVGPGSCSASCNSGEYILQHSGSVYDYSVAVPFLTGWFYDQTYNANGLGVSVTYSFANTPISAGSVLMTAMCCPAN